jgi:putative transposase
VELSVFEKLWRVALEEYDELKGIDWEWQSLDGAMNKSPLGGEKTGKSPTDRVKIGVKRSVLIDGRGVPTGVAVAGANVHDQKLVKETIDSIPVHRPRPTRRKRQHLCLDKAYIGEPVRRLVRGRRFTPHVPVQGEAPPKPKRRRGKARRLLIRWEKKVTS